MSYSAKWQAARTRRALHRATDPRVQARALDHARREARERRDTYAATLDMAAPKGAAA